ncbi:MAG: AAA domain-containing protein [Gammaproteobacteria bacterium]|jgi:DNA-binding NtrC family response regulator|nr:AAA domain-containing protein [Gammaproteobacteria bacterium]
METLLQYGTPQTAEQLSGFAFADGQDQAVRAAPPTSRRHLLVLTAEESDADIVLALTEKGWVPLFADSLEAAVALCERFDVLAGLALCLRPLTDEAFELVSRAVDRLQRLQWLAVLTRQDLMRADVRRLIVGRLRDYQLHPVDTERLTIALGHAWGIAALADAERTAQQRHDGGGRFGLVGSSPAICRLYEQIERLAEADLPVLITGETGTGKELVARALHAQSFRADAPLVALNCAAIPGPLVQSELFGATKGAFTDAKADNEGLIRRANGGTLLLDEIGEMPLQSQASLLRFLEDRMVTPVGGRTGVAVDVAIIASTNRNLYEEVQQGRFRRDLLYRLDVLALETPPLRERVSDIDALAEHFLRTAVNDRVLPRRVDGFSNDALQWLRAQTWHGNVRELRSRVIQAALHCTGRQITAADLERLRPVPSRPKESLNEIVQSAEKTTLERLLADNGGNVSKTARDLQVSRMTLYRLMAKHGIARS